MNNLYPYLVFPGNCKEAMEFYKYIFDADSLTLRTFKDSPIEVTEKDKDRIYDADLTIGKLHIKASDDHPYHPVSQGNNFSLFISFSDGEKRKQVFDALSADGNVMFPLDDNFGMVRDKFDIQWMLIPEK